MFMINNYHMALINDNDFGLEGNTHVQIALVQLKNKIDVDKGILPGGDCIKLKKYLAGSR